MSLDTVQNDVRQELKFAGSEIDYHLLVSWLHVQPDGFRRSYPTRRVNNVYFDRAEYETYAESIAGISSRMKVRYRWYGDSRYPAPGTLEVKIRRNRAGWKLGFPVSSIGGTTRRWSSLLRQVMSGLSPEGRVWLIEYGHPIIMNRYERDYWVSRDGTMRVTVDRGQAVFDQRYSSLVNVSRAANVQQAVVMEVKGAFVSSGAMSRLVSALPLRLSRHSKYCNAVKAVEGY